MSGFELPAFLTAASAGAPAIGAGVTAPLALTPGMAAATGGPAALGATMAASGMANQAIPLLLQGAAGSGGPTAAPGLGPMANALQQIGLGGPGGGSTVPGVPTFPGGAGPLPMPIPPTPQTPSPMTARIVAGTQAFEKQRELALQEAAVNKPRALQPTIKPTPSIPVKVGVPLAARRSPLERYALMLRNF